MTGIIPLLIKIFYVELWNQFNLIFFLKEYLELFQKQSPKKSLSNIINHTYKNLNFKPVHQRKNLNNFIQFIQVVFTMN
jgi:hypothetical protein